MQPKEKLAVKKLLKNYTIKLESLSLLEEDLYQVYEVLEQIILLHINDVRKDGSTYFIHPIEVSLSLMTDLGLNDSKLILSALLHDTLEDHPDSELSRKIMSGQFGDRVLTTVKGLSNPKVKAHSVAEKNLIYQEHVRSVIKNEDVFFVKMMDFKTNALNLKNLNSNPKLQKKLAIKYGPIINDFIKRSRALVFVAKQEGNLELAQSLLKMIYELEDAKQQVWFDGLL